MTNFERMTSRLRFKFWKWRDTFRDRIHGKRHRERVFTSIFTENKWKDPESVSGDGSKLASTEKIRAELPKLFAQYGVRTLLDAPCGDFLWMSTLVGSLERYIGVDIVADLVARNTAKFGDDRVSFVCADIAAEPLPTADLVLCRDCFIHLPIRLIWAALRNFQRTQARYILLTNDRITEPYHDIPIGSFRRINHMQPPFSFPEPLLAINEHDSGTRQLCLWDLQTLPIT